MGESTPPEHDEIAGRLRAAVLQTEPPFAMAPELAVRAGRRLAERRRVRRRVAAGVAVITAAAVALVVTLAPSVSDVDDRADALRGPASSPSEVPELPAYTSAEARRALVSESRRLLSPVFGDLGAARLHDEDGSGQDLRSGDSGVATDLSVDFALAEGHHVSMRIADARSEAEGDPADYCDGGLSAGFFLSCLVDTTGEWTTITTTARVVAIGRDGRLGWGAVRPGQPLPIGVRSDQVHFQRTVKVIRSESVVSYATETVAQDTDNPSEVTAADVGSLDVPPAVLVGLAADRDIALPSVQLFLVPCDPCASDSARSAQ